MFALLQQQPSNVGPLVFVLGLIIAVLGVIAAGWAIGKRGGHRKAKPGLLSQELRNVWNWAIGGTVVGAGVGYLLSSSPLVSFDAVITRGTTLNGFDAVLRPAAEHAFNVMLAGGIVGVIGGVCGWKLLAVGNQSSPSSTTTALHCPFCSGLVTPDLQFCGHCGKSLSLTCQKCNSRLPLNQPFCSACGTRVE